MEHRRRQFKQLGSFYGQLNSTIMTFLPFSMCFQNSEEEISRESRTQQFG